ncbi:hypothetical protein GYA93_17880 [Gordonia desulfuricans]|uniref:Uncharacterized protein n=1 Tax=Gordonia desulfuricans TaxID=89051 RepID=A0A7K3LT25_9ACTN|nr:hypothetical protein [Gordonia desulfuricans]NDK91433.1 hypothetical protein [Gordonia desulfuricans]
MFLPYGFIETCAIAFIVVLGIASLIIQLDAIIRGRRRRRRRAARPTESVHSIATDSASLTRDLAAENRRRTQARVLGGRHG